MQYLISQTSSQPKIKSPNIASPNMGITCYPSDKLSLTGNLTFDSRHSRLDGHPQLRDLNSYADISFKSSSTTMSKMRLDRESVTVFPGNKFRFIFI